MVIGKKWLIRHLMVVVALFIIAAPLGDKHHGLGKHNAFLAGLGNVLFAAFLISFVLLIVAAVVAAVQAVLRRTRTRAREAV